MTTARRSGALAAVMVVVAAATACARPPGPSSSTPAGPAPGASTMTSPTTPPAPPPSGVAARGLAATDGLQREHPLAAVLPHESAHYRIDYTVGADGRLVLRVTLLAVLNSARELATYEDQLRQYKAEALAFVKAQGEGPSAYSITWLPPEAASL